MVCQDALRCQGWYCQWKSKQEWCARMLRDAMVGNANEKASMSVVSDAPRCHGKIGSGRESGKATKSVVRCSVLNATEKSVVPEERLMEEKVCSDFTARMGPVRFAPPFPSLPPP